MLKKLQIQNGGGIEYKKSLWIEEDFFSKDVFQNIKDYCSKLDLKKDPRSDNRLSLCLNPNTHEYLYNLIYDDSKFIKFIESIKDKNLKLNQDQLTLSNTENIPKDQKECNGTKTLLYFIQMHLK